MAEYKITKKNTSGGKHLSSDRYLVLFFLSLFFVFSIFFAFSNNLIYLAILSLVFCVIWFFVRPVNGLYAVALILPTTGLVFSLAGLELSLIDLLALIALSAFFIRYFYIYFFTPRIYKEKIILPYFIFFLLFFVTVFISALISPDPISSLWYFVRWILFFYLAFVVFPFNVIRNFKQLKKTILYISIGALVLAGVGVASLFYQDFSDYFFRAQPLLIFNRWIFGENYNLMSEFLIISSFLLLSLKYFFNKEKESKIINLLFVFLLFVIFLSFGRTAWITVALQLFLYFLVDSLIFKKNKISLKELTLYIFIVAFLISPLFLKMIDLQKANVSSTQNRVILSQIACLSFLDRPLFGNGSGSFVSLVEKNTRFVAKYGSPLDSHGFVQKILAENGIFGLVAFALLLIFIFIKSFLIIISQPKYYKLTWPIFIGALGGVFYQLFNTSYYKGRVWLPVALMLVAIKLILEKKDEE